MQFPLLVRFISIRKHTAAAAGVKAAGCIVLTATLCACGSVAKAPSSPDGSSRTALPAIDVKG